MPWSVDHGPSLICMSVSTFSHFGHLYDGQHGGHLESLQLLSAPEPLVGWSQNLVEVSGQHGELELLKWFRTDIQDGHHGSYLENLKITSAPEW